MGSVTASHDFVAFNNTFTCNIFVKMKPTEDQRTDNSAAWVMDRFICKGTSGGKMSCWAPKNPFFLPASCVMCTVYQCWNTIWPQMWNLGMSTKVIHVSFGHFIMYQFILSFFTHVVDISSRRTRRVSYASLS